MQKVSAATIVRKRRSSRKVTVGRVLQFYADNRVTVTPINGKLLAAIGPKGLGVFVHNGTADRKIVRAMLNEARQNGVAKCALYANNCLYSGPAFDFCHIDRSGFVGAAP